ncbi:hypothetical protein O3P69_006553 [Scylla paramamosain]|uniref:Ig-like domain-containing protein n=1 Tax=Scylla paramamosain TaxID=85552 RepID=A0AAW0U4J1_SCYPA
MTGAPWWRWWRSGVPRHACPAILPPPHQGGDVLLVLWYKNASVTPVYSYDSREPLGQAGEAGGRARQWGDEAAWGVEQRAWFDTSSSPAHLLVRNTTGRDEGNYRCKVHFKGSPSWSQRITLSVEGQGEAIGRQGAVSEESAREVLEVTGMGLALPQQDTTLRTLSQASFSVRGIFPLRRAHSVSSSPTDPPGFPKLQDESGQRLEGPIGPYEDGTVVRMLCRSSGGHGSIKGRRETQVDQRR